MKNKHKAIASAASIHDQAEEIARLLGKAGMEKEQEYYLAGVMAGMQFSAAECHAVNKDSNKM